MDSIFDKLGTLLSSYIENPQPPESKEKVKVFSFTKEDKENLEAELNNGKKNKIEIKFFEKDLKGDNQRQNSSYKIHHAPKIIPAELGKDFKLLGVQSGASLEECRDSYKILLKKYHPDKHTKNPSDAKKADLITKEVNSAFERIKNWYENN